MYKGLTPAVQLTWLLKSLLMFSDDIVERQKPRTGEILLMF